MIHQALPVTLPAMRLHFEKMHGIGNDFVVLSAMEGPLELTPADICRIADRRRGIGCDQVLIATASADNGADVAMKIFNADGSSARQCGNGIRCFAHFVRNHGIVSGGERVRVDTPGGLVEASFLTDGRVRANLGIPVFEPASIPMRVEARRARYGLRVGGEEFTIGAVSMGNPHAVLTVESAETAPVESLGPKIQGHEWFPDSVNVGFMQPVSRSRIRLRVFERGVGETLACGSGACAAVAVGVDQQTLDGRVQVDLNGGTLEIEWGGEGAPMWMTGAAASVFEGEMEI